MNSRRARRAHFSEARLPGYNVPVLPTLAILIGFAFIVAGNQFLGRNDDTHVIGIATMAGGGALILSGIGMIAARERRRIRRQQPGFDILPSKVPESSRQNSN